MEGAPAYEEVSSIDGFQGRGADIVVFVTVRCSQHYNIGFLKDTRRLNVAMIREKAVVMIFADPTTLAAQGTEGADAESENVWKSLLDQCIEVTLPERLQRLCDTPDDQRRLCWGVQPCWSSRH